jgi:hypothetical protein
MFFMLRFPVKIITSLLVYLDESCRVRQYEEYLIIVRLYRTDEPYPSINFR